ncbi:MAG: proline--tRNA ligase, partial [Candidatus Bipolaricaulota bacterium]|nr:proline--tRNA ligase [Candidatus Bipolaricaulota bacterium]
MTAKGVTPQSEDYSRWYTDVVRMADLADNAPVRGCMIIKPYGYELWEAIQAGLDERFKATGHKNAYFPLFIPMSFIEKEAEHVEGFAPELAIVTHGGGKKLEEPLVVRPTSETVIGHAYSQWIQSYRDLPLLINQWANVVRWEMRPRLFLRTTEFLWQEGHTAHATAQEAQEETMRMLDIYADFAINEAAIPVIKGRKSTQEKFAGAESSYTIEAMMGNKWALQSGTSHNLGQNFAKAFDIKFLDEKNDLQYCYTTSWGVSTRMVGGIVMAHGDDTGLRLPPRLAPIQVVVVPIWKTDQQKTIVMETIAQITEKLTAAAVRVHIDSREGLTPGFKFNDWEMRGVPLRMEVGPKDIEKGSVLLARRDIPGREGKGSIPVDQLVPAVTSLLDEVQENILAQATAFRDANLHEANTYDELKEIVNDGWALIPHCGTAECEGKIKEETKASSRCFPLEENKDWTA